MFGIEKTIQRVLGDIDVWRRIYTDEQLRHAELKGHFDRLMSENERLRNDLKWFMHRLNQVEAERATLVFQATGTRIAAPQLSIPDPAEADVMNGLGTPFAGVGEDSVDPADQIPGQEDYSHLPGFNVKR